MGFRACALAAALVLLPSAAGADVRWVTVTENSVAVYKRVDSAQLTSIAFFRDQQKRLAARWRTGPETSILYEPSDVTWARTTLNPGEWVQIDYIDDTGRAVPDSVIEQYWRWSDIRAIKFIPSSNGGLTTVQMWSAGMDIGKPTNITVSKSAALALVRKLSGRTS
jgi:hypothetical protein